MAKQERIAQLEHSFVMTSAYNECPPQDRFEYLADHIFDFTTYDGSMAELFGRKAVEVCEAINERTTFDYIKDPENYKWFLAMCNMPFFAGKLDWGTSIRGAWWGHKIKFQSCGLWAGEDQCTEEMVFDHDGWLEFMRAVVEFGRG